MTTNTADLMTRGMDSLVKALGQIEAEQFISIVSREKLDYTKRQRDYFDSMAPGEFHENAVKYAKSHPYNGNATRL